MKKTKEEKMPKRILKGKIIKNKTEGHVYKTRTPCTMNGSTHLLFVQFPFHTSSIEQNNLNGN